MAKTMEDRKKEGPILPAWMSTVGSYKQLKDGQFKPDILPLIKRYDQCAPDYDKLIEQKKALIKALSCAQLKPTRLLPRAICGRSI